MIVGSANCVGLVVVFVLVVVVVVVEFVIFILSLTQINLVVGRQSVL